MYLELLRIPMWGYCPVPCVFRKIFSCAAFALQMVCLYLASFRSYKALKMTILKTSIEQCNIFGIMADSPGVLLPHAIHLYEALFMHNIFALQVACLYLESFRSSVASWFTILAKFSKIQHIRPSGEAAWGLLLQTIHF